MTDFRNYIYRLAEGVSGEEVIVISGRALREFRNMVSQLTAGNGPVNLPPAPTKTPAGWRYDSSEARYAPWAAKTGQRV